MEETLPGLTTTKAPFIEKARKDGQTYIEQPYELYSEENHEAWRMLYKRMIPRWDQYAHPRFLEGLASVALDPEKIPKLDDINKFLAPLSGFRARAVSGYVPAFSFFDCLRERSFPTTITIRSSDTLDYLPEPDIFHDAAGHVPMHTDPIFADVLVRFGEVARSAAQFSQSLSSREEQLQVVKSILKAMSRFFWFSIEFGLMQTNGEIKVYGSGLLSSFGELKHCVEAEELQRYPFQLEWVVNQYFEIDHYQPLLFFVDSFDHLYSLIDTLEKWITEGKLNNVSPGEPEVNQEDLASFLDAQL